jgi:hypothetical protein
MTDFIPGESYRLDIITADESIIVDSWQGTLKADVVASNGSILVDVSTGTLFGVFVGDVEDGEGNTVLDYTSGRLNGSLRGNVYDANGNLAFNALTGKVTATLVGNIVDADGDQILNTATRSITADTITADTFYGDVNGSITSDSVIYGTFNGDFNGTAYGDFFGDVTGTHTGEVVGDVTGNVTGNITGNLHGDLLAVWDDSTGPVSITAWNEEYEQHEYNGGVGTPHNPPVSDVAKGPVIDIGENRASTNLRANINHYDGTNVLELHTDTSLPHRATFKGVLEGSVIYDDGSEDSAPYVVSAANHGSVLHAINGNIHIGMYNDPASEVIINSDDLTVCSVVADDDNSGPIQTMQAYRGTVSNKTTLNNNDVIGNFAAEGYNGNGYVSAGGLAFVVDGTPNATGTGIPSKFVLGLADNNAQANVFGSQNLEFNNKGTLSAPVFKAKGQTFAERDSMTAEAGMIIFNTSANKFQGYTGSSWVDLH